MNGMAKILLDSPLTYELGWTLVHFLWQGALVGFAYAVLKRLTVRHSPQARYLLSLGTLAALAALPIVTLLHLNQSGATTIVTADTWKSTIASMARSDVSPFMQLGDWLSPLVPWTVPAWCVGVALVGIRYLLGWRNAHRLMHMGTQTATPHWQQTLHRLAKAIGVKVRVQLILTARVAAPCVVGWLRPVILLPPAAFSGLTPLQLEMLLAHELAHIRRHDYLINLLQVAVETLLFYHPVVRWVSSDVRRERELCCDDIAIHASGDALNYAHALADLAALRLNVVEFAVAANGGDLTLRVERLLVNPHFSPPTSRFAGVTLLVATCIMVLMMGYARPTSIPLPLPQAWHVAYPSTVHQNPERAVRIAPAGFAIAPTRIRLQTTSSLATAAAITMPPAISMETLIAPKIPPASTQNLAVLPDAQQGQQVPAVSPPVVNLPAAPRVDSSLAIAELKVISVNPQGNSETQTEHKASVHQYCQPLTGSRVCH